MYSNNSDNDVISELQLAIVLYLACLETCISNEDKII
jgi:hypothetical protein